MASLDDLKKRISSVKSTQKITKAMKMVAASKLRRAQESAEKGRPYSDKMNNIILNLSNSISDKENSPKLLIGSGEDKVHLSIVMTSDRGLCGGFNTNIIKKAKLYFQKILRNLGIKSNFKNIENYYQKKSIENFSKIKIYPNIKKTINYLNKKKIKTAIVTSKHKKRTTKLIKKFNLKVDIVVCPSKNLKGKPYPDQLLKAIKLAKVKNSQSVYVGDMFVDYKAAKKSKSQYIHANYGYGKSSQKYNYFIRRPDDIINLIK